MFRPVLGHSDHARKLRCHVSSWQTRDNEALLPTCTYRFRRSSASSACWLQCGPVDRCGRRLTRMAVDVNAVDMPVYRGMTRNTVSSISHFIAQSIIYTGAGAAACAMRCRYTWHTTASRGDEKGDNWFASAGIDQISVLSVHVCQSI